MDPSEARFNWLFIDMNSFFASAEQHLRPELRAHPVAVIPVQSEGTSVIAASLDAKKCGVRTGTLVRDARRLCPGIVFVEARPPTYVRIHKELMQSIERCAPIHKAYSIDEWSIRLRGVERGADAASQLGRAIKAEILRDFSPHLSCSIGIAATRLLAKIASDLKKPDGLTVLDVSELPGRLEPQKLTDFPGIASSMLKRLNDAGVFTVRDLWNLSRTEAARAWGSVAGDDWWLGFHGYDMPEPSTLRRSITHANMLAPEHRTDAGAHGIMVRLLCKGAWRLRQHRYVASRLQVSVRFHDAPEWFAQAPLESTANTHTIVRTFERLWSGRTWLGRRPSFSQVHMTLSGLAPVGATTASLFGEEAKFGRLSEVMDAINERMGPHAVYMGSLHTFRKAMHDKIAFGRIPDREESSPTDQEAAIRRVRGLRKLPPRTRGED